MNRIQYRIDFAVDQSQIQNIRRTFTDLRNILPTDLMQINPNINLNQARSQFVYLQRKNQSLFLWIFPLMVLGSSVRNSTILGYL